MSLRRGCWARRCSLQRERRLLQGPVRVLPEDVESHIFSDPGYVHADDGRRRDREEDSGAAVGRELAEDEPHLPADDHQNPGDAEVRAADDPGIGQSGPEPAQAVRHTTTPPAPAAGSAAFAPLQALPRPRALPKQ